jgi:hypothetical protein
MFEATAVKAGAPVDQTMWQLVHWRNGQMVRVSSHDSEAEALEAAWLPPGAGLVDTGLR